MKDPVGMVLGRQAWWRGPDGWRKETVVPGDGATLAQLLADWSAASGGADFQLIFEPEGLAHQVVEMPRVGRAAFASLDRIRRDYPAVASEALGWGIEAPVAGANGVFMSLLHFELTPLLFRLIDRPGLPRLRAGWSAFTVAAAAGGPAAGDSFQTWLFLLPDFVALAQWGGARRTFKTWTAPLAEREWKAVAFLLGEGEEPGPGTRPAEAGRRGRVVAVTHGDSARGCPFWEGLRASGRVERELSLDDFAEAARRLPLRHPANLVSAFPRPLQLDRALAALTVGAATVVVAMGLGTMVERRAEQQRQAAGQAQVMDLEQTLAELRRNEAEMKVLRAAALEPGPLPPRDRAAALRGLAAALPEAATLTELQLGPAEAFELKATVSGPNGDAAHLAERLASAGFQAAPRAALNAPAGPGQVELRGTMGGRP